MQVNPQKILKTNNPELILPLFRFSVKTDDNLIIKKFGMWVRFFFVKYFDADDAPFHARIDAYNLKAYKGGIKSFTDIAFRGAAKSTRTKLFLAFCIANDYEHFRKYIKILTKDLGNAKQYVTDIYNIFMDSKMQHYYPEVFAKTETKREETMGSFTTATGIKMTADTVGVDQRGDLQEEARPGLILFDDFETRKTLRSAVETKAIGDNMEEARTGLAIDGACIYNCNYISERGNVHRLVEKADDQNVVMITRIKDLKTGQPKWPAVYTKEKIAQIEKDAEDFEGEYMCQPSASQDVFFDRESIGKQEARLPIKEIAGFKMFYKYDPSHRYGSGHDVGGGVGLDHSTSVFFDFSTIPARVVGTFKSNTIKPDIFGDEIEREACLFGKPIVAPENNKFDMCIGRLRQIYDKVFFSVKNKELKLVTKVTASDRTYGWNTNIATKPKALYDFRKAIEDGLIELSDKDLINECRSYTRDDLMDTDPDPRLSTRHFDLLMAAVIGWQMRNYAIEAPKFLYNEKDNEVVQESPRYADIGI